MRPFPISTPYKLSVRTHQGLFKKYFFQVKKCTFFLSISAGNFLQHFYLSLSLKVLSWKKKKIPDIESSSDVKWRHVYEALTHVSPRSMGTRRGNTQEEFRCLSPSGFQAERAVFKTQQLSICLERKCCFLTDERNPLSAGCGKREVKSVTCWWRPVKQQSKRKIFSLPLSLSATPLSLSLFSLLWKPPPIPLNSFSITFKGKRSLQTLLSLPPLHWEDTSELQDIFLSLGRTWGIWLSCHGNWSLLKLGTPCAKWATRVRLAEEGFYHILFSSVWTHLLEICRMMLSREAAFFLGMQQFAGF